MERPGNFTFPFLGSAVLHLLLLLAFLSGGLQDRRRPLAPLDIELFRPDRSPPAAEKPAAPVEERPDTAEPAAPAESAPPPEPELPRAEKQIVSPPDSPEAVPEQTRLLSEKDSRADEESVKRGEPAPPAEPPRTRARNSERTRTSGAAERDETEGRRRVARSRAAAGASGAVAPPQAAELPGLKDLFAKPGDVMRDTPTEEASEGRGARGDGAGEGEEELASIRRPDLWAAPGERGVPDYLPDVQSGRFTLLNTKADLFAPFVRRVGLRVFQTFSMDFKRQILAGEVPQGKEKVEIEAVMSPDGRRIEVVLRDRSGNLSTDRVLLGTLNDNVFFDENPPDGARADDGRIHFLFALDAAVWYQATDGGRIEPGARWLFAAGLL